MPAAAPVAVLDALTMQARATPGLRVLLLFGSRARGESHSASDWDFAYLADGTFDLPAFLGALVEIVGSDAIDLVDLDRAGGLLRFRAARDGVTLFEAQPRLAERFRLDAAHFWCEASPVLQRGYDAVLARLTP